MNQKLLYLIEEIINGRSFRLEMEIGADWNDAIQFTEKLADKVKELAELSKNQNMQQSAAPEAKAEITE